MIGVGDALQVVTAFANGFDRLFGRAFRQRHLSSGCGRPRRRQVCSARRNGSRQKVRPDDDARTAKKAYWPAASCCGEIGDGPGVNLRRIPLQQHLEIGRALAPWLAALPAIAFEIVAGRSKHIGHAVNEIALAIAVIVDGVFQIRRRQELGLPDLAGPGAAHFARHSCRRDRRCATPRAARARNLSGRRQS